MIARVLVFVKRNFAKKNKKRVREADGALRYRRYAMCEAPRKPVGAIHESPLQNSKDIIVPCASPSPTQKRAAEAALLGITILQRYLRVAEDMAVDVDGDG